MQSIFADWAPDIKVKATTRVTLIVIVNIPSTAKNEDFILMDVMIARLQVITCSTYVIK